MITLDDDDYRPLESFRLKWRWTDARRNLLPGEVLSNIRPLVPRKAREVHEQTPLFHPSTGFMPRLYHLVEEIQTEHQDRDRIGDWLRLHIDDPGERVIASWSPDDAVVTTASIFCDYWDDFCYPASDDVVVSPLSQDWMLIYRHAEVFFFTRRWDSAQEGAAGPC